MVDLVLQRLDLFLSQFGGEGCVFGVQFCPESVVHGFNVALWPGFGDRPKTDNLAQAVREEVIDSGTQLCVG